MKRLFHFVVLASVFIACENDETISPDPLQEIPVVQSTSTYEIIIEEDIVYAEGLSHDSLNSTNATTIPLTLDVYTPNNNIENRPAFMFIHGGGFEGGSKQTNAIINLANYYTSRGWVFFSIDYRLSGDNGTIPQAWADYSITVEEETISQFRAIYPAHRDAKAALRWIVSNADRYDINTDYITVGGGSAGAITAISIGISDHEDFRDEIDISLDPTLTSTHLEQSYEVHTIVDFWGSKIALDALEEIYGHQRFDSNDPPLFIAHGTEDATVPFSSAEELKVIYEANGVPLAYYPLEGSGHGPWNATVDGKRIEELAYEFIVDQQQLTVE